MESILDTLNDAQRQAVTHDPCIPLQILAGPGSGKTKVLTSRVAYLVQKHRIPPSQICAVTFTNKAANEMKNRLVKLIGEASSKKLVMGTFHALCSRFLRKWGKLLKINDNFSICDADESKKLVSKLLEPFQEEMEAKSISLKDAVVISLISKAKSKGVSPEKMAILNQDDLLNDAQIIVQKVYESYEASLKESNSLDFDDLLVYGVKLFETKPNLAHWCRHILVDEFQDTNTMQYQLMTRLSGFYKCLTIVGDPDQSIYAWRSADVENIALMCREFVNTKQILLQQNYRSTSSILAASVAIISQDADRIQKTLISTHHDGHKPTLQRFEVESQEIAFICSEIKRLVAYTGGMLGFNDFAILLRYNALSRPLETALHKQGIPNRILGGQRFFERLEIKDIIAYLQILDNPSFEPAFRRAINTPSRQIGDKSIAEILRCSAKRSVSPLDLVIGIYSRSYPDIKPALRNKIKSFVPLILTLRKLVCEESSIADVIQFLLEGINYEEYLKKSQKDWESRWENVEELVNFAAQFARQYETIDFSDDVRDDIESPLRAFLHASTLSSDTETTETTSGPNAVTISTCHAAKGLEWPVVFIPAVEEDIFPFYRSNDIAEERRLLYVACTRAQSFLYLSYSMTRMIAGDINNRVLSGFISSVQKRSSGLFEALPPTVTASYCHQIAKQIGRTRVDSEIIASRAREFETKRWKESRQNTPSDGASALLHFQSVAPTSVLQPRNPTQLTFTRPLKYRSLVATSLPIASVSPLPPVTLSKPTPKVLNAALPLNTSVGPPPVPVKLASGTKRLGMGRLPAGYHPNKKHKS